MPEPLTIRIVLSEDDFAPAPGTAESAPAPNQPPLPPAPEQSSPAAAPGQGPGPMAAAAPAPAAPELAPREAPEVTALASEVVRLAAEQPTGPARAVLSGEPLAPGLQEAEQVAQLPREEPPPTAPVVPVTEPAMAPGYEETQATHSAYLLGQSEETKAAIHAYSKVNYSDINQSLRGQARPLSEENRRNVELIDRAIAEAPALPQPITVHRGLKNFLESDFDSPEWDPEKGSLHGLLERLTASHKSGQPIILPEYLSTSASQQMAHDFGHPKARDPDYPASVVPLQMEILARKGLAIEGTAFQDREKEILLPRGGSYKVHSIEHGPDQTLVRLEQLLDEERTADLGPGASPNVAPEPPLVPPSPPPETAAAPVPARPEPGLPAPIDFAPVPAPEAPAPETVAPLVQPAAAAAPSVAPEPEEEPDLPSASRALEDSFLRRPKRQPASVGAADLASRLEVMLFQRNRQAQGLVSSSPTTPGAMGLKGGELPQEGTEEEMARRMGRPLFAGRAFHDREALEKDQAAREEAAPTWQAHAERLAATGAETAAGATTAPLAEPQVPEEPGPPAFDVAPTHPEAAPAEKDPLAEYLAAEQAQLEQNKGSPVKDQEGHRARTRKIMEENLLSGLKTGRWSTFSNMSAPGGADESDRLKYAAHQRLARQMGLELEDFTYKPESAGISGKLSKKASAGGVDDRTTASELLPPSEAPLSLPEKRQSEAEERRKRHEAEAVDLRQAREDAEQAKAEAKAAKAQEREDAKQDREVARWDAKARKDADKAEKAAAKAESEAEEERANWWAPREVAKRNQARRTAETAGLESGEIDLKADAERRGKEAKQLGSLDKRNAPGGGDDLGGLGSLLGKMGQGGASDALGSLGKLAGPDMLGGAGGALEGLTGMMGGAMAAAAGPVGAALEIADVAAKAMAGGLDSARQSVQLFGDNLSSMARNDYGTAIGRSFDSMTNSLKEIPINGQVVAAALQAAVQPVRSFTQVVDAFVERGKEIAPYSASLSQANAMADVRSLMSDVKEAHELGDGMARLTDSQSRIWNELRELVLPIKKVLVEIMASLLERIADAIGSIRETAADVASVAAENAEQLQRLTLGAIPAVNVLVDTVRGIRDILQRGGADTEPIDAILGILTGRVALPGGGVGAPWAGGDRLRIPGGL
jgi:hypothetical protein